jgi:hypothetical protein
VRKQRTMFRADLLSTAAQAGKDFTWEPISAALAKNQRQIPKGDLMDRADRGERG